MSTQATRQHFVDIQQGCIAEVMSGAVKLPSHVSQWDHTLTFRQRKHWLAA